ncbi:putative DNA-binding domain-containing protein [Planctomicrobium sp. SH661]|uniref:HvfC/BufC family peptide modification chaperone n=1 Tax=Planctomicrobium sp. SH661 TaxID=3448124 RepID=UPI003F5CB02D
MKTPPPYSLDVVQRWMLSVITHPHGIATGMASPLAREQIDLHADQLESVIDRSLACTSEERLAIYSHAYFARLIECLEAEFPAVRQAVGDEAFRAFAAGYLKEHPPASYTLNTLGSRFPDYLADTRPNGKVEHGQPEWIDFVIELARLERLYSEVFDGPGEESLPLLAAETLQSVPAEEWEEIRLETSPSLRLVQFQFPVHEYITAVRQQLPLPSLKLRESWLAVNRRDFIVRRRTLSQPQWILLQRLQSGDTLGAAIEQSLMLSSITFEELARELGNWFRDWAAAGYFRGLRPD